MQARIVWLWHSGYLIIFGFEIIIWIATEAETYLNVNTL